MNTLPPPEQIPLNSPQLGPDGAHYVKLYVEDLPGKNTEITHNLGRVPFCIHPVWANKAVQLPEVVSATKEKALVRFVPDWVSTYTSKKFIVLMRFF